MTPAMLPLFVALLVVLALVAGWGVFSAVVLYRHRRHFVARPARMPVAFFVLVTPDQRVADVSMNQHRARCLAKEHLARGNRIELARYEFADVESVDP